MRGSPGTCTDDVASDRKVQGTIKFWIMTGKKNRIYMSTNRK